MRWFRRSQEVVGLLAAEVSDLREQLRLREQQWAEERAQLLDRILALSNPNALREVRRPPNPEAHSAPADPRPRRLHYPGYMPSFRPPISSGVPPSNTTDTLTADQTET